MTGSTSRVAAALAAWLAAWAIGASAQNPPSSPPAASADPAALPAPPRGDTVDVLHGVKVPDPYRELENARNPATLRWLNSQGEQAADYLSRLPMRNALRERITALAAATGDTVTDVVRMPGDRIYYMKRRAGQSQFVLMMRTGLYGPEQMLVDPQGAGRDRGVPHSVDWYVPSWDGQTLAFGLSAGGSEDSSLVLLDLRSGRLIGEPIPRVHGGLVHWAPDSQSLTYNQLRELPAGAADAETYKDTIVYHLRIGQRAAEAQPLFSRAGDPELKLDRLDVGEVIFETGGRYMLARTTDTTSRQGKLFVAPLASLNQRPVPWRQISGFDDKIVDAQMVGDALYVLTFAQAPQRRVLKIDLDRPSLGGAVVVVPEPADAVIERLAAGRGALYTEQRRGFSVRVLRHPLSDTTGLAGAGVDVTTEAGSARYVDDPGRAYRDTLFLQRSWTLPTRVMVTAGPGTPAKDTGLRHAIVPKGSPELVVREVEVRSHDGALVPLAIIHRKNLPRDGRNPTVLIGYGAYGDSFEAHYDPRAVAWFENGGVLAFANVRGSGARGDAWYRAGYKTTKANTWKDGIACARFLIDDRVTSPYTLGVWGTSAGGIFAGRAATSAPELFSAAIFEVGMMDTVRAEETANGATNVSEFGTVQVRAEFEALLDMSTYHQIRDDTGYPGVLLLHGMNDPRVEVWHSAKAAARLQAASTSKRPVLLRLDEQAGHGIGSTAEQAHGELADIYAFLLSQFDRYADQTR